MNIFRLHGDVIHMIAMVFLPAWICRRQSCAGVSGKAQLLYGLVFCCRYPDIFFNFYSVYNHFVKVLYLVSFPVNMYLIYGKYHSTYDRKHDTFRLRYVVVLLLLAIAFNSDVYPTDIFWAFSIYLESIAILPQLYMIAEMGKPAELAIIFYLSALWSYRALYIINWIYRYNTEGFFDIVSIVGGVIQTLIYGKFFYHYVAREIAPIQSEDQKEDDKSANDDSKPKTNKLMVLECWPGCCDYLLVRPYKSQEFTDDIESLKTVRVIVKEPEKDDKIHSSKVLMLPSTKI